MTKRTCEHCDLMVGIWHEWGCPNWTSPEPFHFNDLLYHVSAMHRACLICGQMAITVTQLGYGSKYDGDTVCSDCMEVLDKAIDNALRPMICGKCGSPFEKDSCGCYLQCTNQNCSYVARANWIIST